jgi:hypothetical protein
MAREVFDYASLALTPGQLAEAQGQARPVRARKAAPEAFVQLPYGPTLGAAGRLRNAPLAVLVELAYQSFKTHKDTVLLSNAALRAVGISPDAKVRALRRLEAAGMVKVAWRGGKKTPLVTLLWK